MPSSIIVPDTNLFYGSGRDLDILAEQDDTLVTPSLLSAFEILCAEDDSSLPRRKQAAQNWLKYSGNAIHDNEVSDALNLGYQSPDEYVGDFVEAMKRLTNLEDTSLASQQLVQLDLSAAIVSKQVASAQFVVKVGKIFSLYREEIKRESEEKGEKIPYAVSHEKEFVRARVNALRTGVEDAHFNRIDDVANQLGLNGINSRDRSRIKNYIDIYLEFVVKKICEGGAHINDFIDLQFFSYLDRGYKFASKEKKWNEIAALAGKQAQFIAIA